ncbi:MAG: type II toxin-antitoxin system RelE/ParE family toxin [Candidatus Micrarchaeota archaeon]
MPYELEVLPSCKKEIYSLCRKNTALQDALQKKIIQILENPHHFKPLRKPLQNKRRVHVLKSFVLIYEIIEEAKTVRLFAFSHHDDAY